MLIGGNVVYVTTRWHELLTQYLKWTNIKIHWWNSSKFKKKKRCLCVWCYFDNTKGKGLIIHNLLMIGQCKHIKFVKTEDFSTHVTDLGGGLWCWFNGACASLTLCTLFIIVWGYMGDEYPPQIKTKTVLIYLNTFNVISKQTGWGLGWRVYSNKKIWKGLYYTVKNTFQFSPCYCHIFEFLICCQDFRTYKITLGGCTWQYLCSDLKLFLSKVYMFPVWKSHQVEIVILPVGTWTKDNMTTDLRLGGQLNGRWLKD